MIIEKARSTAETTKKVKQSFLYGLQTKQMVNYMKQLALKRIVIFSD